MPDAEAPAHRRPGPPLGVGLVGCGMIGQIHADGLRKMAEDGEIVAVGAADPSPGSRDAVERNCPFGYLSDDARKVIEDPAVEAVMITSPTATHRDLVLATLEAGKALLCEKPLAPSIDDVRFLCDAVEASGRTAQVGFHSRFHPIPARLRQAVTSGELGAAMAYTLRDDQYWPTGDVVPGHSSWRSARSEAGGGALLEHSIHAADLVCWLFGPARRVWARTRSVFGYDVEDVAAVTVEHDSGVVGTLLSVFNGVRGREERRFEVFFEGAAVEATTDFIVGAEEDGLLLQRPDRPAERPDLARMRQDHFAALGLARRDFVFYTYPADRHWVQAVVAGAPASPGFADARRAHELVDAAYRSAASGQAETVPA
ncbi:MAG TPA: Gfo/Idh/MocA family oxidoreductase [Acidimicrobiales bacterium]|nr:Gfo/Idh/MocA family oxidoreductase [Acidimicrobiales bacterium]